MPSSSLSLRILCPNGHLGFAPIKTASFRIGLDCAPDLICADSGSCDVGPGPLRADVSSSPLQWQKHDLEPLWRSPGDEFCVVVQAVAPTREMAEEVCMTGTRQMFLCAAAGVKGTAGGVAFLLDEVMPASPGIPLDGQPYLAK